MVTPRPVFWRFPAPWTWGWCSAFFQILQHGRLAGGVLCGKPNDYREEGDGYLRLVRVENENRIRQGLKQMRRALTELEKDLSPNNE